MPIYKMVIYGNHILTKGFGYLVIHRRVTKLWE